MLPKITSLALLAMTSATFAQAHHSLIYTVRGPGLHATISGSSGLSFEAIGPQDLAVVTPGASGSAETYLNKAAFNAVHGDKNCDGGYVQANLGQAIDALMICGHAGDPRFADHFISVRQTVGTPGSTDVMSPGDIASPRPDGSYAFLIREAQIRSVFDIDPVDPVNVDAVAMADDGSLFLSLEDDVFMLGGLFAEDGALLMIPGASLYWDGCEVADTSPGTGLIVAGEGVMTALAVAAGVSDVTGLPVTAIEDLDGLELDPRGGTWFAQGASGAFTLPNVLFCGEALEGGAVLSTYGGGSIAELNGHTLGKSLPMPQDGVEIGLLPGTVAHVGALNGLALVANDQPLRVLTEVSPAIVTSPSLLKIEWAGADAGGLVALAFTAGSSVTCGNVPAVPVPNRGFGYLMAPPTLLVTGPLPCDGQGFGSLVAPYSGGVPGDSWLCIQVLTKRDGLLVVGAPAVVQF